MHVVIWEFRPKQGFEEAFVRAYGPDGDWVRFFERDQAYIESKLLHDTKDTWRYLTVDCWTSLAAYDSFHAQWAAEYREIDERCQELTDHEKCLGSFASVSAAESV